MSTEQPQEGGHKKPPIPTPAKKVPAYNIERRGDRLYQVQSLHKWFAISSLALFVFTVGMVLQDYSREWKRYQREFNRLAVRSTQQEAQAAAGLIDVPRYNELIGQLQAATAAQQDNSGQIAEAQEQVAALNAQWIRLDQNYRFTKAQYDVDKYDFEEALAAAESATAANASNAEGLRAHAEDLRAAADATEAEMDDYFLQREQIDTELEAAREALAKLQAQATEARAQIVAMRSEYDRLLRQANTLDPGALVTTIINAPLMDFMSPSLTVRQVLLPNLFYDHPFKQIARVDRCTTCHLGIDNTRYENEQQPFKTHPNLDLYLTANSPHPVETFGCTSCHGGLDRATDFQTAGHTPRDEAQQAEWEQKYGWHVEHYLMTPMESMPNVQAGCYKCHNNSPEVPMAANLNNGRDLIRIYGCFGCHRMPGYEGVRKVGPDLSTVSGKLTRDWVAKWLANPKAFKSEARMPKFWYNSNNSGVINGMDWDKRNVAEINAITEYLWSKSTPRTLPARNTNGNAERGKQLVETVGCYGCHSVGPIEEVENRSQTRRRHGYNLENQGGKVTANWIANWVRDPRQVWADSKMPSLRLTDAEAADITAYLSSLRNPEWDKQQAPQTDVATLDAVVFEFLRAGSTEARAGTELAAMSLEQKNLYAGEKLIERYGCYACHNVPGFEEAQPIGTELTEAGSKLLSQLDFGFLDVEHSRSSWYTEKLKDPRIFDVGRIKRPEELLRMPNFGFDEDDVKSLVMVLTSMVKDPVPLEMKDRTDPRIVAGRQLVAEKNCRGCHIVEGLGSDIRGFLRGIEQQSQIPPNLNTQGQKTQPEWLRAFLKDPGSVRLRPWLNARMPTFHFTEHEVHVLGQYFSALEDVDWGWIDAGVQSTPERLRAGARLFELAECQACHPTGTTLPPGRDPSQLAPNLELAHERLRPEWIVRWLTDPQLVAPNTSMPNFFGSGGTRTTQFEGILNNDVDAQIRAIRDHLFTLGGGRVSTASGN